MPSFNYLSASFEPSRAVYVIVSGAGGLRRIQTASTPVSYPRPLKIQPPITEEELDAEDAMWAETTIQNAAGATRLLAELREEIKRGETFSLEDVIEERIMEMEI